MSEQPQPNPFKELAVLTEYLGGVNAEMDAKKAQKDGYHKALNGFLAHYKMGNFGMELFGTALELSGVNPISEARCAKMLAA